MIVWYYNREPPKSTITLTLICLISISIEMKFNIRYCTFILFTLVWQIHCLVLHKNVDILFNAHDIHQMRAVKNNRLESHIYLKSFGSIKPNSFRRITKSSKVTYAWGKEKPLVLIIIIFYRNSKFQKISTSNNFLDHACFFQSWWNYWRTIIYIHSSSRWRLWCLLLHVPLKAM